MMLSTTVHNPVKEQIIDMANKLLKGEDEVAALEKKLAKVIIIHWYTVEPLNKGHVVHYSQYRINTVNREVVCFQFASFIGDSTLS